MPHKDPAARRKYITDYRAARTAAGLCQWCGKQPAEQGSPSCGECKSKANQANDELRKQAFARYGQACCCCGVTGRAFLTIDHIEPAHYHARRARGETVPHGNNLLRRLRIDGWPDGYQTLCWNCNISKAIYGACPHQHQRDS